MRNYNRTQKQPQISNIKCIIFYSLISFSGEEISYHDSKETGIDGSLPATGGQQRKKNLGKQDIHLTKMEGRKEKRKEVRARLSD